MVGCDDEDEDAVNVSNEYGLHHVQLHWIHEVREDQRRKIQQHQKTAPRMFKIKLI
jgi:hypothetical protein